MAGVAIGDIDCHFVWQAWHLRHWAGSGGAPGSQLTPWAPLLFAWQAWRLTTATATLRGSPGTWLHPASLSVAGVVLTALGRLWWCTGFPADAVGAAALCVAGLALGDIQRHFAWQAWHLQHVGAAASCMAGMALGESERHFAWQAWQLATSSVTLRGRHGTYASGLASLRGICVQGVAEATSAFTLQGSYGTYGTGHELRQLPHITSQLYR